MNIGIIGLDTTSHHVAKGIQCAVNTALYAAEPRDIQKAKQFKEAYQTEMYDGDYEALLKDKQRDMGYICTPNF